MMENKSIVTYDTFCRECQYSEKHLSQIEKKYYNFKGYDTEYFSQKLLNKIGLHKCRSCNSDNILYFDIILDDVILFDFEKIYNYCIIKDLDIVYIKIEKSGNGEISTDYSGGKSKMFLEDSLQEIKLILANDFPIIKFKGNSIGFFEFCIVGRFDPKTNTFSKNIMTIRFFGFDFMELSKCLDEQIKKILQSIQ